MTHTCVICKEKIIEAKEKWVRLSDYDKKQQTGETFYHLECWRDRFNLSNSIRKQKMYKKAQEAMGGIMKAIPLLQQNFKKPDEVYEIKD